jgi:DNA-binding MarR family transcriptional regulator
MSSNERVSLSSLHRPTTHQYQTSHARRGSGSWEGPTQHEFWILRTLLHTPLLRVKDLRACTGLSQASLYRLLHRLQEQAWIEAVIPSAFGHHASACYYLTERGLRLVAAELQADPATLARTFQADERGLRHLLPRLGEFLRVQEFLWDLCLAAPEYLTYQGQRSAIAWHWMRDYRYRWHDEQGRSLTCTVSALLTLRKRPVVAHYPDALREEAVQHEARAQEVWYSVQMLLDHALLSGDAITRWLQRLAVARTACAPASFPPVLIVVAAPERAALWHAAMRYLSEAQTSLRLSALLAVVPADLLPPSVPGAIWRLAWHDLLTQAPCHLQDVLQAGSVEAVPPFALASLDPLQLANVGHASSTSIDQQSATEPTSTTSRKASRTRRTASIIQGGFAHRLHDAERHQQIQHLPLELSCLHLSERAIALMIQVECAPGASNEELAAWEGLRASSVGRTMTQLRREGWVHSADDILAPSIPDRKERWVLTERGIAALTCMFSQPRSPQRVISPLSGGNTLFVSHRAAKLLHPHVWPHQQGLYHFFALLARAAPPFPDASPRLIWWNQDLGTRRYHWNGASYLFQPDATAEMAMGERVVHFWLEYAARDSSVRDLARTLSSYVAYLRSRAWTREQMLLPLLCYLVQGPAGEQRLARVVQKWQAALTGCRIAVTTVGRVEHAGVLAPIWWPLSPSASGEKLSRPVQRIRLLDL